MEIYSKTKNSLRSLATASLLTSLLALCACSIGVQDGPIDSLPDPDQVTSTESNAPAQTDAVPAPVAEAQAVSEAQPAAAAPVVDPGATAVAQTIGEVPTTDASEAAKAQQAPVEEAKKDDTQSEIARLTEERVNELRQIKIQRAENEMRKAKEAEQVADAATANQTVTVAAKKHGHKKKNTNGNAVASANNAVVENNSVVEENSAVTFEGEANQAKTNQARTAPANRTAPAQPAAPAVATTQPVNNPPPVQQPQTQSQPQPQTRNPASMAAEEPAEKRDPKNMVVLGGLVALAAGGGFWLTRKKIAK